MVFLETMTRVYGTVALFITTSLIATTLADFEHVCYFNESSLSELDANATQQKVKLTLCGAALARFIRARCPTPPSHSRGEFTNNLQRLQRPALLPYSCHDKNTKSSVTNAYSQKPRQFCMTTIINS